VSGAANERDARWAAHHGEWRDPLGVMTLWEGASDPDRTLLAYQVTGAFWETLARADGTLLVTREYEHLILALRVAPDGQPRITGLRAPHPSGIAVDRARGCVHIACTRNPNQVMTLQPLAGALDRLDMGVPDEIAAGARPLMPARTTFYPGCLYMHDLAMIGGVLHANSVGQNAVVRLSDDGTHVRVWHPRCIERDGQPVYGQNHIQLNSIAAGDSPDTSYYSASADVLTDLRPGHPDYPVNKRGVIFSGQTREPLVRGLTRPHSARLADGALWVDNSGYGELWRAERDGTAHVVARLPGWTRGLCLHDGIAWVGTSRVIPRFRQYAPGLDVDESICGLHAVDMRTGAILGSLTWAAGNQLFAIEMLPTAFTTGLPFPADGSARRADAETRLFYAYTVERPA
jgi:uncharacterized protein (TIGR03032 family)